jgi:hypothetical protein
MVIFGLTTLAGLLHAQEPEGRLVDRLLRPDLSLTNSQQNKEFVAAEGTSVDKKFETRSYSVVKERPSKSFFGIPDFFARAFATKKFARGDSLANTATSASPAYAQTAALTKSSALVKKAPEVNKAANTRDYSDNRPFLDKGTRQEILSQQDHPLSIEQVRELLNRDKSPTDSP